MLRLLKGDNSLNDKELMQIAINEAIKGLKFGDQPFGAVLAKDGEIISTGRNLVNSTFDITAHAETVAIRVASSSSKVLNLPNTTLYASWEPCPMCLGAIMSSGISRLVLGGRTKNHEGNYGEYSIEKLISLSNYEKQLSITTGILEKESELIVYNWKEQNLSNLKEE
jgi:tRNA(adenine34) deaminase